MGKITKQVLLQLATHASETGNGVTVTKFWKQGSVDYKRIPELGAVNLDNYRGRGALKRGLQSANNRKAWGFGPHAFFL